MFMLRRGRSSKRREQDMVRKWDGLASTDGRDSIQANRKALPIRA